MKSKVLKLFGCFLMMFVTIMVVFGVVTLNDSLYNETFNGNTLNLGETNWKLNNSLHTIEGAQIAAASNFTYSVNGGIVTLHYANSRTAFSVNRGSDSYTSARSITGYYGGSFSNGTGKVSLPNGTYYFYAFDIYFGATVKVGPVTVTNSCNNDAPKLNQKANFTLERCLVRDNKSSEPYSEETNKSLANCAEGYKFSLKVLENTCLSDSTKPSALGLNRTYCKVKYQGYCTKEQSTKPDPDPNPPSKPKPVAAPKLSSLSVSSGTLSPSFKSGTTKYSVTVGSNVSSIKVNATAASGSSFVSGSGPRTVNLNYGTNSIKIKVKNSSGTQKTYTITVTRPDGRSTVNTLSNLKVSEGVLSPVFDPKTTNYTVDVDNSVTTINVDATLTDSNSKFSEGFGPNTYTLELGPNKIYVKVVSEKGDTNVYNITVNRATLPSKCTTETEDLALLKQIDLKTDLETIQVDQIEDFDPKQFTYSNIKVPFQVINLTVEGFVVTEGDTVLVEGTENLEVGETREVKITVTSKECPNFSNVYTINVQRQPEIVKGDKADAESITIENHDEFEFAANQLNYNLFLNKGEDKLNIEVKMLQEDATYEIIGNEDLGYSSEIVIRCKSGDEEDTVEYKITIDGVQKGTNVFLIIIVVILILLVLIYLVLRLLGYRIYFNFGSLFRGMNEKVKNVFDN